MRADELIHPEKRVKRLKRERERRIALKANDPTYRERKNASSNKYRNKNKKKISRKRKKDYKANPDKYKRYVTRSNRRRGILSRADFRKMVRHNHENPPLVDPRRGCKRCRGRLFCCKHFTLHKSAWPKNLRHHAIPKTQRIKVCVCGSCP